MPSGPRVLFDNSCYHIMARGNQKRNIFREEKDYEEYIIRIIRYKKKYNIKLYAYCLMPNHIHIMGMVGKKQNLSNFMHNLTRSYTAYFNEKYEKVGYLWQGRFKSRIILKDKYLISCIQYIETNPVRAEIVASPEHYPWSSFKERIFEATKGLKVLDSLTME